MDVTLQLAAAFFGTLGFGVCFNIRGKKLLLTSLGGVITWALYLLLQSWLKSDILCYFLVSLVMSVYAEILARLLKTPAATFCTTSLIVLVPGSGLYYTISHMLEGDMTRFFSEAGHTLGLAAALSVGIILVTAVSRLLAVRFRH